MKSKVLVSFDWVSEGTGRPKRSVAHQYAVTAEPSRNVTPMVRSRPERDTR